MKLNVQCTQTKDDGKSGASQRYNDINHPPFLCELHFSMMQPTPMGLGGGQPQVMVMASSQPASQLKGYNGRAVVALGITQIIIGVLCITFQVIFFVTSSHPKFYAEANWPHLLQ